jgi:hypothetical protein
MHLNDSYGIDLKEKNDLYLNQEMAASFFTLADGGLGDWFGGILFSAGQQANEAVLDQLSSLSFTRCIINSSERYYIYIFSPDNGNLCLWFYSSFYSTLQFGCNLWGRTCNQPFSLYT